MAGRTRGGGGAGLFLPTAAWCDLAAQRMASLLVRLLLVLALLAALADPRAVYKVDDRYLVVAIDGSHSITAPAQHKIDQIWRGHRKGQAGRAVPGGLRDLCRPPGRLVAARPVRQGRDALERDARATSSAAIRMLSSACGATASGKVYS